MTNKVILGAIILILLGTEFGMGQKVKNQPRQKLK